MRRTLLAVFAHPDDETFGTGGTLAHYARQGVDVHLVCATRGEVGEAPPDLKGFVSIADMRSNELMCASNILGLESVSFLGYRDSGMLGSSNNSHPDALATQPTDIVARQVAAFIRRLKPNVVVTFDPIGGYRHPDHIAIQRATVEAIRIAADAAQEIEGLPPHVPQKLYYSTFSRRFLRAAVRVLQLARQDPHHFGKNRDIDIASLVDVEYPIHARVSTRDVIAQKQRAFECHSSQGGVLPAPVRWLQRLFAGDETFMRAIPSEPPARIEQDLFEGISE
jgi:LmbE family N-acetylglucosaminyl deacetylase